MERLRDSRALKVIEVMLYLVFIADCFVSVAATVRNESYISEGAGSAILLMLTIGLIQRWRHGPYYD